jgi:hypothetical protein
MAGGNKGQKAQKREMLEVETPEERNERLGPSAPPSCTILPIGLTSQPAANMDTDSNDQTLVHDMETACAPSGH